MPNPISTLPHAKQTTDESERAVDELEVDEGEAAEGATEEEDKPLTEVEAIKAREGDSAPETGTATRAVDTSKKASKSRFGLIALLLAVLLVGSVAINLKQSRDVATLETRSSELEQALTAAVNRIDSETVRARVAESALDRVDVAVDVVNERVLGLQEALDSLREATVRD